MIKADQVIDVKGLLCPQPLLMAKQALKNLQSGQILQVIADDITTKITFVSFVEFSGHALLDMHLDGPEIHHYIRKK